MTDPEPTYTVDRDRVAVVLVRPRFPENIGASARAMKNMGLSRLIVVNPENPDWNKAAKMATNSALDVLKNVKVEQDLATALADFGYVVGTTARLGGRRKAWSDPSAAARELIGVTKENDVAILFGSEDRGLEHAEVRLCHALWNIPTENFSSLNLAQSVMIVCYELFRAGLDQKPAFAPRLANRHELDGMYDKLTDVLTRIGFVQADNPDHWMDNIRRFFARLPLTAREVKIIRGVFRQMDWYTEKRFQKKDD